MNDNSRNKEVVENKFLIDRLLQKLLESGKITQHDVADLKWRFRKELLLHESKPPKERLEILVTMFKEYKKTSAPSRENLQSSQTSSDKSSSVFDAPSTVIDKTNQAKQSENTAIAPDEIMATPEPVAEDEKDLKHESLGGLIGSVVSKDNELPKEHAAAAVEYIKADTTYLRDVVVNDVVIRRLIEKSLFRYKQENNLLKPEPIEVAVPETSAVPRQPHEALRQPAEEHVSDKSVFTSTSQEQTQQSTQQSQVPVPKQEPVPTTSLNQVRLDPAAPTPVVSTPQQQAGDSAFKVNVTSHANGGGDTPHVDGKSLAQQIMAQARAQDQSNPLVSHQVATERPNVPDRPKKKVSAPTSTNDIGNVKITEEVSTQYERSVPKAPPAPHVEVTKPEDLAKASNTKMTFDRDVQMAGETISNRHEARTQQMQLFDKYLAEQIEILMEVAVTQSISNKEWLDATRAKVEREARELVDVEGLSISDKIHKLDAFFAKKRTEIAQHQPVENKATIEDLVNTVMARAGQEVRTEDKEADARFRDTLRDTLHFKAKHLIGVDMEIPQIQMALNEEYAKHKAFYLKSVK